MTEKALDREFSNLIQNIKDNANKNIIQSSSEIELKKTFPNFVSPLLNQPNNNLCQVDDLTYQCMPNKNINEYLNVANSSKNMIKSIPEQLTDNNYDNIYINKTFENDNICRVRGTNQHINLNNNKADPNISKDSDNFCVFKGANIG